MSKTKPQPILRRRLEEILHEAADTAGISVQLMLAHRMTGQARIAPIRDRFIHKAATEGFSTPEIGYVFNRDHSSILTAIHRHEERQAIE